ncbi:MAG TPA: type II toxin-antitoxin system prevent-host-death family antitoxin [Dehalococcoidia bacterium]|nr:type II toxin-antitoxin system prevent-host-death family antitoxin [Dehalococcoidia bacterium]
MFGRTVGAYEAKTKLPQLLDEVAMGNTVTITKHGVPVAQLVPYPKKKLRDLKKVIEEFEEWQAQQNITLGGITIRELIEEGRR